MQPSKTVLRYRVATRCEEMNVKRTALILATVAALGTATVSAPAEARYRGWGPGIGFGLAAGALAAGAFAASRPYYYEPGYEYYGPRYRRAYYGPSPYAYYGPRYYGPALLLRLVVQTDVKARSEPPGFFVGSSSLDETKSDRATTRTAGRLTCCGYAARIRCGHSAAS